MEKETINKIKSQPTENICKSNYLIRVNMQNKELIQVNRKQQRNSLILKMG